MIPPCDKSAGAAPADAEWRELLQRLPGASVYHSPEFHRALQLAGLPCRVTAHRREGRLEGLALVLLDRLFPLPLVGFKAFAPAGLLAADDQARMALMESLDRALSLRCLYLEQYVEGRQLDDLMAARGQRTTRHRNFLVDLVQPAGQLRSAYSRGLRRNIRAAERAGFRWRLAHGPADLASVNRLLMDTSRRVGAPPLPWPLLKAVYHELVPAGMCRIYVAEPLQAPIIVSTRVELLFKGRAIDWFTGTSRDWTESQVGSWLVDRILEDLRERGVAIFDFGGGGRVGEHYGPAEFKRRFGGREIEISRHQRMYHPLLTRAARAGWRLFHRP